MNNIKLTDDQILGLREIDNFINSNKTYMIITGFAGTGKTFMVSHIRNNSHFKYVATTHAAVEILRLTLGLQHGDVVTLPSYLGLRLESNSKGNQILKRNRYRKAKPGDIVVIDEASMIDNSLWFHTIDIAKRNRFKIIFMGDEMQLPPVREDTSSAVLNSNVRLTKVIRQSEGSPILKLAKDVRERNKIKPYTEWDSDTKTGVRFIDYSDLDELFIEEFTKNTVHNVRMLAYTNRKVNEYNKRIREIVYGKDADILVSGEELISNSIHYGGKGNKEMLTSTCEIMNYYKTTNIIKHNIRCKQLSVVSADQTYKHIIVVTPEEKESYIETYMHYKNAAITETNTKERTKKWKKFYNFKTYILPMFSFNDNGKIEHEAINYAYATTIHKAQGTTLDSAYLDVNDLKYCIKDENKTSDFYTRLLYTAVTRPKSALTIVGKFKS